MALKISVWCVGVDVLVVEDAIESDHGLVRLLDAKSISKSSRRFYEMYDPRYLKCMVKVTTPS